MMKQLDPSIPSLDTIKRFELPGFTAPKKVLKSIVVFFS